MPAQKKKTIQFQLDIPDDLDGGRLDKVLAKLIPQYSRERIKFWIQQGWVYVENTPALKWRQQVHFGEKINIQAFEEESFSFEPENIPFEVVEEDSSFIIINKPMGLIVHPAAGHYKGTLVNGLLYRFPELSYLPRAGIIHRLDKDTSGLLIVARTLSAHTHLIRQMQLREIKREYIALVYGTLISGGTVHAPISRHPRWRTQMAVVQNGKEAVTHYRIKEKFPDLTLLDIQLKTGRTHQIRVHMAHLQHGIVGDPVYGRARFSSHYYSQECVDAIKNLKRQALHACHLIFHHPVLEKQVEFFSDLPEDIQNLLSLLRKNSLEKSL